MAQTKAPPAANFVGAYIPPPLKRALEQSAKRADRSTSAELRMALRAYLNLPAEAEEGGRR